VFLLCLAAAAEDDVAILTPKRMKEWVLRGEDDWVVSGSCLAAMCSHVQ
jgi:hypothetical protein